MTQLVCSSKKKSSEDDFATLKAKGYNRFFRGSQLKYYYADKMRTCRKGKASNVVPATAIDKPFLSQAWLDDRLAKADDKLKQSFEKIKKESDAQFESQTRRFTKKCLSFEQLSVFAQYDNDIIQDLSSQFTLPATRCEANARHCDGLTRRLNLSH